MSFDAYDFKLCEKENKKCKNAKFCCYCVKYTLALFFNKKLKKLTQLQKPKP